MSLRSHLPRAALVAAIFLPLACSTEDELLDEDLDGDVGKGDVPVSDDQLINTTNNTLELLFGWDYLHDAATASRCVQTQARASNGPDAKVGERQGTFDLEFVSDRSELATELGLDLAMQAEYSGVGVDAKMNLVNKFAKTSTSVSYLVKIQREYIVRHRHPLELSEIGAGSLRRGMSKFLSDCGTHYVRGMRYAAELYVMITYNAASQRVATELKAELGIDPGVKIPGVEVKGDLAAKLAHTATREGVSVDVSVAAQGFVIDRDEVDSTAISRLLGQGVNEKMFETLDQLYGAMQTSVERDVCRDTGSDACWPAADKAAAECGGPGQAACGYYFNNSRNAIANGVSASMYTSLPNWDESTDDDFELAMERIQDNEDYLRTMGEMLERIARVYVDEIKPFRNASQSKKAAYNLPVGTRAKLDEDDAPYVPSSVADLVELSDRWEQEFLPSSMAGTGSQVGLTYERVEQAFKDCWQRTAVDLQRPCGPETFDQLHQSGLWQFTEDMLDEYASTGRVLPIAYAHDGDALIWYSWAQSFCEKQNFGTPSAPVWGRLPTKVEAEYLAPLVGFGSLDWSDADRRHSIWFEGSEMDGCIEGSARVLQRPPSASKASFVCVEVNALGNEILPVCVPAHGPIETPHRP